MFNTDQMLYCLIIVPIFYFCFRNCLCSSPLSANSKKMRAFYRAFLNENYTKDPGFFQRTYLDDNIDFYEENIEGHQNPTQTDWWQTVTQNDIDRAFPNNRSAIHCYLTRARTGT